MSAVVRERGGKRGYFAAVVIMISGARSLKATLRLPRIRHAGRSAGEPCDPLRLQLAMATGRPGSHAPWHASPHGYFSMEDS